jgi:hypothetical protein
MKIQMVAGALAKARKMKMAQMNPEDEIRSLNEIQMEGDSDPADVANPHEQDEAMLFANALRKRGEMKLSPESFAKGGLVEGGSEEDEILHGTQPEYSVDAGSEEPMRDELYKPSSATITEEAKKALMMRKQRRSMLR